MQHGLSGIHPQNLWFAWPRVEPLLREAIDRSTNWEANSLEAVHTALHNGKMQLWVQHDVRDDKQIPEFHCAMVTEIIVHPGGKICRLQVMGGKMTPETWQFLDTVMLWALDRGCDSVTCYPRPGLAKRLKERRNFQFVKKTECGDLYIKDLLTNATIQ